jgi:hypothetical protein
MRKTIADIKNEILCLSSRVSFARHKETKTKCFLVYEDKILIHFLLLKKAVSRCANGNKINSAARSIRNINMHLSLIIFCI